MRQSPTKWKTADGEAVVRALEEAKANPVNRPLGWRGRIRGEDVVWQESVVGVMTIPEDDRSESTQGPEKAADIHTEEPEGSASTHTEIQYLLVKLGFDMGFDFHVATNDQSRAWRGQRLGDLPHRRKQLPQQFDPQTNRTIELIDVLWLKGNSIVAAFEIESTTSIYSGASPDE